MLLFHPWTYGDAVWYALDIAGDSSGLDPGHLLWKPLGKLVWSISSDFIVLDPIYALQALSGFFWFISLFLLSRLCELCDIKNIRRVFVYLAYNTSSFAVTYALSGSSYVAAASMIILAVIFHIQDKCKLAIVSVYIASLFWGVAIIFLPAFFFAKLKQENFLGRFVTSIIGAAVIISLLVTCHYYTNTDENFLNWLGGSNHGISGSFSFINLSRALAGLINVLLFQSALAAYLKGLLLGQASDTGIDYQMATAYVFVITSYLIVVIGVIRQYSHYQNSLTGHLVILSGMMFAINFVFAWYWQGSDVERWCFLLVPLLMIGALVPRSDLASLFLSSAVLVIAMLNLQYGYGLDSQSPKVEIAMFADRSKFTKVDLIIVDQSMSPRIWSPLHYFHKLQFFPVNFQGKEGLVGNIKKTLQGKGRVYTLNSAIDKDFLMNNTLKTEKMDIMLGRYRFREIVPE